MKQLNSLMQQIIDLTARIETDYPELYRFLDETPLSIGKHPEKEITVSDLKNYLETLRTELEQYIKTHQK